MFSAATASALCNYMVGSTIYYIPHPAPFDSGKPDDPDHAGALLVAMPITMALVALLSGWLSDRIGSRLPTYDRALRVVSTVAVAGALASLVRGRRSST